MRACSVWGAPDHEPLCQLFEEKAVKKVLDLDLGESLNSLRYQTLQRKSLMLLVYGCGYDHLCHGLETMAGVCWSELGIPPSKVE